MALWVCAACGCAYSAGAPCCPRCRSKRRKDEDVTLKINRQGVVSDSAAPASAAPAQVPASLPAPDPAPATAPPVPSSEPEPAPAPAPVAPKAAPRAPRRAISPQEG